MRKILHERPYLKSNRVQLIESCSTELISVLREFEIVTLDQNISVI